MALLTLPLQCSIDLKSSTFEIEDIIKSARFDEGYQEIEVDGPNPHRRKWAIQYNPLNETDRTTLKNFLDQHGAFKSFLFTPVNSLTEVTVKRDKDSLKETFIRGFYIINFSISEQFIW